MIAPRLRPAARLASGLLCGLVAGAGLAVGVTPASALNPVDTTRFAGADRFETARLTAEATFPGGATEAVLARGDKFPDALAGSYLAGDLGAPILLTGSAELHDEALEGLDNLGVTTVHLLGSEAAISDAVRDELVDEGFDTDRLGGEDRYETASLVAEFPGQANVGSLGASGRTAIVASGEDFPDALAGGPISYAEQFPTLLTPKAALAPATEDTLEGLDIEHVLLLGGPAAVTDAVETEIEAMGITVDRLFGLDRNETAAAIANFTRDTLGWTLDELILATGGAFPDAVASGPLGGERNAPVVLAGAELPAASEAVCAGNEATITDLLVEGSSAAVSQSAVDACIAAAETGLVVVLPTAGYVWVDDPSSAESTPDVDYQYNSTGAVNTVDHPAAGQYLVTFPGLASDGGVVHVTAYGANHANCKTSGWSDFDGPDMFVSVLCFDTAGNPVDSRFNALFTEGDASLEDFAFVWADDPDAPAYEPSAAFQFNSKGGTNVISRSGAGQYRVAVRDLASLGGTVKVTAYGSGSEMCKVLNWGAAGFDQEVNVRCFDTAGNPVDSRFTMTYTKEESLLPVLFRPFAYLWTDKPGDANYTPIFPFQFNSTGADNTITRTGVGQYTAHLPGVQSSGGHVQVTAFGAMAKECQVHLWIPAGGEQLVAVRCYDAAGILADAAFTLQWVA